MTKKKRITISLYPAEYYELLLICEALHCSFSDFLANDIVEKFRAYQEAGVVSSELVDK